jgi:hypothetical protein
MKKYETIEYHKNFYRYKTSSQKRSNQELDRFELQNHHINIAIFFRQSNFKTKNL